MRITIGRLRATLPPSLKIPQYRHVMNRCMASAYDEMARLPAWVPQKDRVGTAAAKSPKHKSRRPRSRQREPGVRP